MEPRGEETAGHSLAFALSLIDTQPIRSCDLGKTQRAENARPLMMLPVSVKQSSGVLIVRADLVCNHQWGISGKALLAELQNQCLLLIT